MNLKIIFDNCQFFSRKGEEVYNHIEHEYRQCLVDVLWAIKDYFSCFTFEFQNIRILLTDVRNLFQMSSDIINNLLVLKYIQNSCSLFWRWYWKCDICKITIVVGILFLKLIYYTNLNLDWYNSIEFISWNFDLNKTGQA